MTKPRVSLSLEDAIHLLFCAELAIAVMDNRIGGYQRESREDEIAFTQKIRKRFVDRGLLSGDMEPIHKP